LLTLARNERMCVRLHRKSLYNLYTVDEQKDMLDRERLCFFVCPCKSEKRNSQKSDAEMDLCGSRQARRQLRVLPQPRLFPLLLQKIRWPL
jgi:hypothetical protein